MLGRREFLKTAAGSVVGLMSLRAMGASQRVSSFRFPSPRTSANSWDVRDLILWAPFKPFSPGDTDLTVEDPSDGTQTGILKATDIIKGQNLTLQYWHEHGGIYHMFTITPDHFNTLKSGNAVVITLPTTIVEDHFHVVIIDPKNVAP